LIRLAIKVRRDEAELVLAELLELAPSGVEETTIGDDVIEYAVYGPPGELPALPDVRAAAGGALVDISTEEVPDNWDQRWRQFHTPLVLEGVLTVRPPWAPPGVTPVDLVIDPAQAFGTGAHATTRMCLELMLELEPADGFLDLGCGSGVLAIAAAKLGWAPVVAIDSDRASVEATRANAGANAATVEVRQQDLRSRPAPTAPTVAANLLTPLLVAWAASFDDPPFRVIASGLLSEEADTVLAAFAGAGLLQSARRTRGEWGALLLERGRG
jgi:ribosomal protein L11 methyltransferase